MLGQHRPASETPFKWRFAGGRWLTFGGIWSSLIISKKKEEKNVVGVGRPLAKLFMDPRMKTTDRKIVGPHIAA